MFEAYKLGFMYAAGALSAGVLFLAFLGTWDWVSGWLNYLIVVIRLARHRGKGGVI